MKYGKDITEEICTLLSQGMGRVDSCSLADVSYETFTQWMKKPEFSESIKRAETKCKQRNVALIQKAALSTWQAAAWWLERKYPEEFALRQKLEHSGKDGGPISWVIKVQGVPNA